MYLLRSAERLQTETKVYRSVTETEKRIAYQIDQAAKHGEYRVEISKLDAGLMNHDRLTNMGYDIWEGPFSDTWFISWMPEGGDYVEHPYTNRFVHYLEQAESRDTRRLLVNLAHSLLVPLPGGWEEEFEL